MNAGLKIRWLGPAFLFFEFNQPKSKHIAFVLYCPADHIEKGTVDKLEKSVDFPKQADNFHEASELILISQRLNDYDSPAFKNTLAKAVNGPISLAEERAKSSDARNRVFELVMAAQFRAAGFTPKFVEPTDAMEGADMTVTVESIKCFVECKRIQSENAVEERVREASSQIEERLY